jgi:hypothetical protein
MSSPLFITWNESAQHSKVAAIVSHPLVSKEALKEFHRTAYKLSHMVGQHLRGRSTLQPNSLSAKALLF